MKTAVTLSIEKLVAGGDGLAFWNGRAVFIPGTLPGERIAIIPPETKKRDWLRTPFFELIEASPKRVQAVCPHYGECGGCDFQHIDYRSQLEIKASIVKDAFIRIGRIELDELGTVPSTPFSYRNRVQLHSCNDKGFGFKRASSSSIVPLSTCPISVPSIREWIERNSRRKDPDDYFSPLRPPKDRFIVFAADRSGAVFVEGRDTEITVTIRNRPIRFHIKGFFQSNLYLFDFLIAQATSGLEGKRVADLYCGVGPFSLFLKDTFHHVVGVENNPYAIAYARQNVGAQSDTNTSCSFSELSVEDWIETKEAMETYDAVLCDPPRSGLSDKVRAWIKKSRPKVISYVSCDPVTCARDSSDIAKAGYRLTEAKLFDFYPQTSHIELCTRFELL